MRKTWLLAGAASALMAGASYAQEHHEERDVIFTQAVPAMPGIPGGGAGNVKFFGTTGFAAAGAGATVEFLSTEMSFEGSVVKGAPYSAEAVTESTQTLTDGNKISRKTSTMLYRDGEGRSRREVSLPAIGPWATSGTAPVTIFINDPVAGFSYVLESIDKTAHKRPFAVFAPALATKMVATMDKQAAEAGVSAAGIRHDVVIHRSGTNLAAPIPDDVKEEKLQSRLIEGVQAEVSRTTFTIPAGQVGNQLPLVTVSERWYSPELKTVVKTTNKDPRLGETTYTLTGIQRAEPSRSLFEVPSDYTVVDDSNGEPMRLQRKIMVERSSEKKD